jgi:hypothetical protein
MPSSMYKMLLHGSNIIKYALLPIELLSDKRKKRLITIINIFELKYTHKNQG